ncbi:hypothetical protein SELMODRAFT_432103 [Selaginella moellendorffii]|uniref:Uncharacterized protein n=1 Tax=Selaginella moellendorffii TaxID=88036 RepID=D8TEZ9_SELML|nr:hypothetical protein SELMODRAFT_432103 [Selaginella moellendorffii]
MDQRRDEAARCPKLEIQGHALAPMERIENAGEISLDRLVYKLVGDDGSVLPSAEDDDLQLECFAERENLHEIATPAVVKHGDDVSSRNVKEKAGVHSTRGQEVLSNDETVHPSTVSGEVYFSVATRNVEGKRKRKPNRRYIEDETDNLYFTSELHRLVSDGTDSCDGAKSHRDITEKLDSGSDIEYPEFESPTQAAVSYGGRRSSMMKLKAERKASKIARLAWSSRKRGPSIGSSKEKTMSSSDKESYSDLEGGMDQMLEDYEDVQSMGGEDCELDFSGEHVETVPTPNGGTRRKHHRPWTLREVMILVEGVARCGGGKWADIKKLEFSSVSYRTAVDLKDKWRNLLRASRVHFTSKQQQFLVVIKGGAQQKETFCSFYTSANSCSCTTSRSGRTLRRK